MNFSGKSNGVLRIIPLPMPAEIRPGDSLATELLRALKLCKIALATGDILVIKHKIVSKAEGRLVELNGIRPSPATRKWARKNGLDARVAELALAEARRVV